MSNELDAISTDNHGTVRPRHEREFPGGLWQMILENSFSRVLLGVHWSFDGFAVEPDGTLTPDCGGVPLGLNIADDIYTHGLHPSSV